MPRLSLIIPVYNEAEHLERFLRVIDELQLPVEKELVIINDCSRDGSDQIIKNFNIIGTKYVNYCSYRTAERICRKGSLKLYIFPTAYVTS